MSATSTTPRPQPYNRYPGDDDRPTYAAGLRHLADLVEANACPVPFGAVDLFLSYDMPATQQAAVARDLMRALGGGKYDKDPSGSSMSFDGMCGGVPIRIYVERDAVCERVVVGTENVEVPARPAVEAHTEVREVVEWRCGSLLDAAAETADAIEVEQPVEVSA